MRLLAAAVCLLTATSSDATGFLSIPKDELCKAEPYLETCPTQSSKLRKALRDDRQPLDENQGNPFDDVATRAPSRGRRKHYKSLNDYYRHKQAEYYNEMYRRQQAPLYSVYPSLRQKDGSYCSDMRGQFAFTCQPSKPLRLDLVEFCKDYSAVCGVPNFHRLPGPRMGPPPDANGVGHVDISGKFGFSVGAVPGLEVGVGWGVDVGPIPGMGESVGVGLGLDLGVVGAKSPEAYRRGMDNPNAKGGGIFGIQGGVGVNAPGAGPIGVGTGLGVGK